MAEKVSVIVPTRNSVRYLGPCLESIRAQTYPHAELIVVDNHSEDGTAELAQRHADVLVILGPERSTQRNEGARRASGAYLLFIDSDMVLQPEVVAQCLEVTKAGSFAGVIIPEESFGEGFWARCKAFERSFYLGDETIEAARFFPRSVFEAVGGFDERMPAGPEDWDLHQRVRARGEIGRTEAIIRHDEGSPSLRELMAKKYYYGKGIDAYRRRHPEAARRQLRFVRPAFLRGRSRLRRQPALAAGMLFMKGAEFAAGGAGLLSSRIRRPPDKSPTASPPLGGDGAKSTLEGKRTSVPREPGA